jgi:outer membrane beta-barrel protein
MTCRSLPTLLALLAALALPASALGAQPSAQEPENEGQKAVPIDLEDKMPPVSGRLFLKNGRFEISPTLSASLADAFFQKYSGGLKLNYHLVESISVGLFATYSLNTPSSVVSVCKPDGSCKGPELAELTDVPGKLGMMAGVDVAWAPMYGKFSLFAEKVLHFDLAFVGGLSAVQYQVPGGANAFAIGGHFGVGQRYFITPNLTLRVELRDYVYNAQTVKLGNSSSKLQNQIMFELGLSYFAGSGHED